MSLGTYRQGADLVIYLDVDSGDLPGTVTMGFTGALSGGSVNFVAAGEVHLNNAGYAVDAATLNAKVMALGW